MTSKPPHAASLWLQYRRRLIRKRLVWRAFRSRHDLELWQDRRDQIKPGVILGLSTMRNEMNRVKHFFRHYRGLGVGHFLIVDNDSDDGTAAWLARQPDVSLWHTCASYKAARFGVDWLNWLKWRYAHRHWVVVSDADELLIYPDWERRDLADLTGWMEASGQSMMGAIMLDMYPRGPVDAQSYDPGCDPLEVLRYFDPYGYWVQRQRKLDNLWLQGGPRARRFFADRPERAPTLNKIPLVHWRRGYCYVNSTHSALPAWLNKAFDTDHAPQVTGALLHTKFLPGTATRARREKARQEHFQVSAAYAPYYDALMENPDLWFEGSLEYTGWEQLLALGLISRGNW